MKGSMVTILMLAGALGAGGTAAYLAGTYIDKRVDSRRAELESQYKTVRVVVANTDLPTGTLLVAQNVAVREMPRAFLSSEAIPADQWSNIAGHVLAHAVRGGDAVLMSHLAQDAGAGFSAQLTDGMRALTFPVDDEASISGMLAPGDRIDIFFTTTAGNESTTLPLLSNVPVVATGIRTQVNASYLSDRQQRGQYNTVTVQVTPEDAARITLAQSAGKITITLRRPQDDKDIRVASVTKNTLLFGVRPAVRAMRARVEVILGGR